MAEYLFLDVIIATLLVILVYSTIVSAVVEYLNNLNGRQKRQMYLYLSIKKALDEPYGINWGTLIYKHPHIHSLKSKKGRYPVYIAPETFAEALISVIRDHKQSPTFSYDKKTGNLQMQESPTFTNTFKEISSAIDEIRDHRFKQLLGSFLTVVGSSDADKLKSLKTNISTWFQNYQDRVIGDYTKSIRRDLLGIGISLALLFNVNLISIVNRIINDGSLRSSLVAQADKVATDSLLSKSNFTCKDCSVEKYSEKYDQLIDKQLFVADSLAGWMYTSGLPILWEIPKTGQQQIKDFMFRRIVYLKEQKFDSVDKIIRRYCLIHTFFDEGTNDDTVNLLARRLAIMERKRLTEGEIGKALNNLKLELSDADVKEMNFLFGMSFDSTSISKCFSAKEAQKKYTDCFGDCSCIDKVQFRNDLLSKIDNQIRADQINIETLNESDLRSYVRVIIEDVLFFPWKIIKHNLKDIQDIILYFLGAFLMGIASVHGATRGFELLVKLINIRNAGLKPKASQEKK